MMRRESAPYAIQTVTRQFIDQKSPASTVLDLVKNLPSMNVSSADTSGIHGGGIESRGLTDADMAILLDGVPASSAGYIDQNVDSENVENVSSSPGAFALDAPVTTSAGGVLQEDTVTPSHRAGGTMDFSYGTNNMSREFLRLQSGDIGNTGVRTYLSGSHTHARQWMGEGANDRQHIDFGLQKDFRNASNVKLFFSWNNNQIMVDNYATAQQFHQYKHLGIGYNRSNEASGDNYWKNNISHFNTVFLVMPVHIALARKLSLDITPYFYDALGWDSWGSGLSMAGSYLTARGAPVGAGQQLVSYWNAYSQPDVGVTTKLGYDIDAHNHFHVGYWYANNFSQIGFPVNLSHGGATSPSSQNTALYTLDGARALGGLSNTGYEIHSLFVQDEARYLDDRLRVNAGFKFMMTNYWMKNLLESRSVQGARLGANSTVPLPQLSISYDIDRNNQIYIHGEGDFRQPDPSTIQVGSGLPKNQYSIKEELGYRYHDDHVMLDLSLFNYNITNRLMNTYLGGGVFGSINAGNQTVRGFDLMISGRPYHHFSPYASLEYLHATIDSNIPYGSTYLRTKGNGAPMAPKVMANFGLSYNDSRFFGNFALHYAGSQSVTLVGDQRMPGYVTDSLSIGYHFKPYSFARSPTFKLNFQNLTGAVVRTGPVGIATNLHQATLLDGSMLAAGSGAEFYVLPRFSMTGTISTDF
ncbi:TonB-dependent receptor plug domain-containing protein [Gluconacetobacter tumulicola]|uniref:TonB-dependent receptor plug domain-containing protein n=2 Tax=Gluconacetobacter tumulicola TaxID=1017177 RepID=A0A7W4P7P2_9PROT|nr:TonB-dependent receptor plug domain-containing protein [Gluconacetobacter tumulicola]